MGAAFLVPVGKKYGPKLFEGIKNKSINIEIQSSLAKLGSLLSKGIKSVTAEAPTLGEGIVEAVGEVAGEAGEVGYGKSSESLACQGGKNSASTFQSLTRDDAREVVSNLLENGEISIEDLEKLIPENTSNTFVPTSTMKDGAKYEFTLADGQKVIIRWHEPDPVAASKYPGCTSGTRYTVEIKVGNKQLKIDGGWSKNQSTNDVHIPIKGK